MTFYRTFTSSLWPVLGIIVTLVHHNNHLSISSASTTNTYNDTAGNTTFDNISDDNSTAIDSNTTSAVVMDSVLPTVLALPFAPTDCPPSGRPSAMKFHECADNCNRLCRFRRNAYLSSYKSGRDFYKRINGCRKSCSRNRCRLHSKRRIENAGPV